MSSCRIIVTHALVALAIAGPSDAVAHGLDPGQLIVRLAGATAYVTATPTTAVLADFDSNGDGRIDRDELTAGRTALLSAFEVLLRITDANGHRGERTFSDASIPHRQGRTGRGHVRITLRYRWIKPPTALRLTWSAGALAPLSYRARRMTPGPLTRQRPAGPLEHGQLDARHPERTLLIH